MTTCTICSVDLADKGYILTGGERFCWTCREFEEKGWSREWPTELGWYWFCGYRSEFSKRHNDRELIPVKVRKMANGSAYVTDGTLLYQSEGAEGWWLPMQVPTIPKEVLG